MGNCLHCGVDTVNKSYCSKECANIGGNTLIDKSCIKCGFIIKVKRRNNKPICKLCQENSHIKQYKLNSFKIFERDNFKCIYCGRSSIEHGMILQVEHVMPEYTYENNSFLNIVTSCYECNFSKSIYKLSDDVVNRIIDRNKKLASNYSYQEISEMEEVFRNHFKTYKCSCGNRINGNYHRNWNRDIRLYEYSFECFNCKKKIVFTNEKRYTNKELYGLISNLLNQ
jgi:5-methylcytosine-specific restriction endonuclease McrA